MKIHHNTLKKAQAHGLVIIEDAGEFFVFRQGEEPPASGAGALAAAKNPKDALDLAILALSPAKPKAERKKPKSSRKPRQQDEEGEDGDENDEGEGASVVKHKYKMKYKPHKMTCGDALAQQIRAEFMTVKDPDTKKLKYDWAKLTAFAKANGCWSDSYKNLNKGMRRMNIVNRLRAKVESDDYKPVWNV